ncbi:Protein kinase [Quillaja saponaria]|uniref:Protein kinase n=1 Tax=Quillaja saponaria TaxID=32244 RepID=A0AAD7VNW0_QUISA|nr:Protein kinase [Quillaja saponaria]
MQWQRLQLGLPLPSTESLYNIKQIINLLDVFMAKLVFHSHLLLLLMVFLAIHHTDQLQLSQSQTLLKVQQLFDYPPALNSFNNITDFCNIEPTPSLTIVCYEDNLTQLHITGNSGFPLFPENFPTDSLFATLASLSSLKVLSLASLSLTGPLPGTIGELHSLEILNVSSNGFNGTIPTPISNLRNLQTLILDENKFTGQIPIWVGSFPGLAVLSLKNNLFSGSLPNSMSSLQTLRILTLSKNQLSGKLPDFRNLTNLQVLDLESNDFGPHFPYLPTKLVSLVLRNNSFRFGIPSELGSCYQLQKLDISLNGFVGPFLPSLLSLPSVNYLDISANKFTGMLFQNMSCNTELVFVNLSSNLLKGELPTCLDSKNGIVSFARNCLSNNDKQQHPTDFCLNEALAVRIIPDIHKHRRPHPKTLLVSAIVGGFIGGIAILGVVFLFIKGVYKQNSVETPTRAMKEYVSTVTTAKLLTDARCISQTMKMGSSLPAYKTFALEELKEATNNFDASCLMGEGSHAQIYKGKLPGGTHVTIRSLKMRKRHNPQTNMHHLELISKLRHSHLVSALGHCLECCQDDSSVSSMFLIFEFVPSRTLRSCISGPPGEKLSWTQRIAAAIGVVKGVQFLHTGIVPGVFSHNLKITDILLDNNLNVKISSYNLPLLAKNREIVGAGTLPRPKGNIQPSVKDEEKNDVYDIGVILLEIILGRPIMFHNEVGVLKDLVQVSIKTDHTARRSIVDPAVHKECSEESLKTMMEICVRCLSNEPTQRPSVEDVLWNLQFAAQVQNSWRHDSSDN